MNKLGNKSLKAPLHRKEEEEDEAGKGAKVLLSPVSDTAAPSQAYKYIEIV